MSQIVDGYTGKPNIYADVIGEHNISMYGSGDYVLQVGECLGYELISNNEIHVKDGMFIIQGRRGYIKKGTTDICVIENGAQAVNRNDLIIIEYAKDQSSQVESHTTKVIKGTPGETAADPDVITGDIPNGAILHQMPLYRVKIEGLNIVAVEQLFEFGSVAAETVDPMLATEDGFAADAKLTRDAFNQRIPFKLGVDSSGNYGYIKDGADTVTPFKKGYEDTPGTATAATIKNGKTAWVNGKKITGTYSPQLSDIKQLHQQSGTWSQTYTATGLTVGNTYLLAYPHDFDPVDDNNDFTITGGTLIKKLNNSNSACAWNGLVAGLLLFKATATSVTFKSGQALFGPFVVNLTYT